MRLLSLLALLALFIAPARAVEEPASPDGKPLPGHSMHGDAFNEGPRQAAVLIDGTGNVSFPVTTKNALAQKFFTQGVGQLHGFWYFEAERSFRQVAALDPDCAMAFWGMAMANINNPKRAAEFIKSAVAKKPSASRREQLWIGSLADYHAETKKTEKERRAALVQALEDLSYEFPDDLEAKAFLVFQIWDNKQHGLPLPSRQAVDALAKQVLAVNPMHPVHHYLIHLWNGAKGDKRALESAARGGQTAPAIAHMWHMPGHTFSNLRRYADAAWQQEASARVDHARMIASRIMPEQIHNYAHNNDWLVKNLQYVGRVRDAVDLAKNMIGLPRLGPTRSKAYDMGRERLLETLVRFELWDDLAALEGTMYLAPGSESVAETRRLAALGVAWFSKGDTARGAAKLAELEAMLKKVRTDRIAAVDAAEEKARTEKKSDSEIDKAMTTALRSFAYRISTAEAAIAEVKIYQALAAGSPETVKPLLKAARDLSAERRARVLLAIGDKDEAVKIARQASDADPAQVQPLANLAAILWSAAQEKPARETFKKLRALSADLDPDLPVVLRLAPIAQSLKLAGDWRVQAAIAADAGARPDLKSLGPFRWSPSEAPDWSLTDGEGRRRSLADYRGKAVLLVFYLGSGCSHCIEQLNIFSPQSQAFADAGIQIVAVSTDSADGLHRTFEKAKDRNGFPFPIVADAGLDTFKAYRAFDDFEHIPLHGTFLIDGNGLIRWQDISYEPFRDASWLLGEAKRLLSAPL